MINIYDFISEVLQNYPDLQYSLNGSSTVLADDTVQSVIDNLIGNAILHGKATKIEVLIVESLEKCSVSFSDNGIGVPENLKDRIFEEGFKFGETGNTGMGLFIVKKTMENFEGKVTVSNNKPQGSIFTLEFRRSM